MWQYSQQESPPAWTQEAYCPPCSEYSFCCPILADPPATDLTPPPGYWPDPPPLTDPPPTHPGWTDPPLLAGQTWPPSPCWLTHPPPPTLAGLTWPPPPAGQTWPPPKLDRPDPPPCRLDRPDPDPPPPPPPRGWTDLTPPPLWTDKHLWKQYLPVVLRTRAVKIG